MLNVNNKTKNVVICLVIVLASMTTGCRSQGGGIEVTPFKLNKNGLVIGQITTKGSDVTVHTDKTLLSKTGDQFESRATDMEDKRMVDNESDRKHNTLNNALGVIARDPNLAPVIKGPLGWILAGSPSNKE